MTIRYQSATRSTDCSGCAMICLPQCSRKVRNDDFTASVWFLDRFATDREFRGSGPAPSGAAYAIRDRSDSRRQLGAETTARALCPVRPSAVGETGADAERSEDYGSATPDARFARRFPIAVRRTQRQYRHL